MAPLALGSLPALRRARSWLLWAGLWAASSAGAYTIQSPVTDGCHERITAAALERAGWPDGAAAPAATAEQAVLAENLPFQLPAGADPWEVALLAGVRDNDLHGAAILDLPEHAEVDLVAASQPEHCLRTQDQDGAEGDAAAVAACREYILSQVREALGEGDTVDLGATEPVALTLRYQKTVAPLSRYAYRMGRALHALQDSFTHTYRAPDFHAVRSVFNYVDPALASDYSPGRDGPAHVSVLDRCAGMDEVSQRRFDSATAASAALLAAMAEGSGGRAGRLERAQAVLGEYFTLEPGCGPANDWCGSAAVYAASEQSLEHGCAAVPGALGGAALVVALGVARRRRR